jgi:hypothetical protein
MRLITNHVLTSWQDFKETGICFTFIDLLNHFLGENCVILIKQDCRWIEDHLRRLSSSTKTNFRGKIGYASVKFGKAIKRIAIRSNELQSDAEIEHELLKVKAEKCVLEETNTRLHERCGELQGV